MSQGTKDVKLKGNLEGDLVHLVHMFFYFNLTIFSSLLQKAPPFVLLVLPVRRERERLPLKNNMKALSNYLKQGCLEKYLYLLQLLNWPR